MKRAAIIQSSYLPWKGYFDIIHEVDHFVFLDDVQFTVRDWRTRNRIKTREGLAWLSVPAGSDRKRRICDVVLTDDRWQAKHWQSLVHSYGKAPHFHRYAPALEAVYREHRWERLSDLNQYLTRLIATDFLGIVTPMEDSRTFSADGAGQDRLLDILQKLDADHYLSGPAARSYIEPSAFARAGITLEWKNYGGYPEYPQFYGAFEHAVTVLDLLFQVGPDAPSYIWGWRQV